MACAQLIISNGKNMKKKIYSPHLSIKRLQNLGKQFVEKTWKDIAKGWDISDKYQQHFYISTFIHFVDEQRPSLASAAKRKKETP